MLLKNPGFRKFSSNLCGNVLDVDSLAVDDRSAMNCSAAYAQLRSRSFYGRHRPMVSTPPQAVTVKSEKAQRH